MACEVVTLPFLTVLDLGRNLEAKVRVVDPRSQSLAASQLPEDYCLRVGAFHTLPPA